MPEVNQTLSAPIPIKAKWLILPVLLILAQFLSAQRTLLSDPGQTYNDTDGPTFDFYGPVDVSTCSSVRFELDFNFSLPWEGSGNMESSDECNFNPPGCPGDPNNPLHPDCANCWDFLWAQFLIDGAEIGGDLIGESGTTNAEQSGTITLDYCTMGQASTAQINVTTQTWAGNESVTFSSIMIICYEGIPDPSANPNPICDDEMLNLNGNIIDPGVVSSSNWSGPGSINDPGSLNTTVENIPPGTATYTLTVTDVNGCQTDGSVMVTVYETPQAFPAGPLEECESTGGQAVFNLTELNSTITGGAGGTVNWYRDPGLSNQISNPNAFLSAGATVFAIIDNGFCQSEVIEVELIVLDRPDANPATMEECEDVPGSGVGTFDLSTITGIINGGTGLTVNFFRDPAGTLPVGSPYQGTSGTIYARVVDGPCESDLVAIELIVKPSPDGRDIEIRQCEDIAGLGYATINLNDYRNDIASGPGLSVDFFEDDLFLSRARNPFDASLGTTIVYARVSNGECHSRPIRVTINVLPIPGIISRDIEVCEDPPGSGLGIFVFDSLITYVIGNQQGISVNWYADSLKTESFENPYIGGDTILFAEATNGLCSSDVVRVRLKTIPKPLATPYRDTACADQSGTAFFDLSEYDHIISGDIAQEEVFYASDSLFTNLVNTNFRTDDTVIYARVRRGDCESDVVQLELVAIPGPILSGINDVVACDSFVLGNIPGINLTGNEGYYLDPDLNGPKYREGESLKSTGTIYYYDELEDCSDIDSFYLEILSPPEAGDSTTVSICEGAIVDLGQFILNGDNGGDFFDTDGSGALTGNDFNASGLAGSTFNFKYRVPGSGPCDPDSTNITVMVETILQAGRDTTVRICLGDTIDLTDLISGNSGGSFDDVRNSGGLSGRRWFSLNSGVGTFEVIYRIGDGVVCPMDEAQITITVDPSIVLDRIGDITICDRYILPEISGINAGLASYFTGPSGTGAMLEVGDTLVSDMQVYVYGTGSGFCEDEFRFVINILESVEIDLEDRLCFEDVIVVGSERFDRNRPSGVVTFNDGASNGCDSTVNVNLTFRAQAIENIDRTLCRGQSLTVNGTLYDQNNPFGQEVMRNGSYLGCDSIVNITLSFDDYAVGELKPTICNGDSITINGRQYFEGQSMGSDTLLGQGSGGCDSIVNVNVTIYRSEATIDSSLCRGDGILINGTLYDENNAMGQEVLRGEGRFGCDSVIDISLTFRDPAVADITRTLCFGDSLVVNGTVYNERNPSGTELMVGEASNGCDSTINISLTFQATTDEYIDGEICEGDTVLVNGRAYYAGRSSGRDTLKNASVSGCDSVLIIDLEVLQNIEKVDSRVLCPTDEVVINGTRYNRENPSGVETFPGLASNGCDSIFMVDLDFEDLSIIPSDSIIQLELGDSAQINLFTNFNHDSIYWMPTNGLSCDDCLNPHISAIRNTTYTVVMISENGCEVRSTIEVSVRLDTDIYIPNVFSPNADNLNDRLTIYVKEGKVESIDVFNIYSRWGELIYSESGTNPDDGSHRGWNGTFNGEPVNPGVYIYQLDVRLRGDRQIRRKGSVTVIR